MAARWRLDASCGLRTPQSQGSQRSIGCSRTAETLRSTDEFRGLSGPTDMGVRRIGQATGSPDPYFLFIANSRRSAAESADHSSCASTAASPEGLARFWRTRATAPRISRRRLVGKRARLRGGGRVPAGDRGRRAEQRRPSGAAAPVSVIFRGGKVYTLDDAKPWAKAVGRRRRQHRRGRVGRRGRARWPTRETKIVDLRGRMLMPGFVEGHIHPFMGSFMTSGVDLQVPTSREALAAIARYAKAHPTGPVRGFGWRVDMFPPEGPTREMLDAMIPDRPAFFFAIDGHSLWANSKALEIAGVAADTPDPIPDFSYFVRDKNGRPTGYILEVAAVLQIVNAVDPISRDAMKTLLDQWLAKASAAGITSVYDAGVPPIGEDQGAILSLYTELEEQKRLPFRVMASYLVNGPPVGDATALRAGPREAHQHRSRPGALPQDHRRRHAGRLYGLARRPLCRQARFDRRLAVHRGGMEEHDRRRRPRRHRRPCPRLRRADRAHRPRRLRGGDRRQPAARPAPHHRA